MYERTTPAEPGCHPNSERKRAWRKLRKRLARLRRVRFIIDLKPPLAALRDPELGPLALEAMLAFGRSAVLGGDLTCNACDQRWSLDRVPAAIASVTFLDVRDTAVVLGLCPDCVGNRDRVIEGLRRDFGLGSIEVQALAPGGRA